MLILYFALLVLVFAFAAGYCFSNDRLITAFAAIFVSMCFASAILYGAYADNWGIVGEYTVLDPGETYKLDGQVQTAKGNVMIVENQKGDVYCIRISGVLPPRTQAVKRIERRGNICPVAPNRRPR